MLSLFMNPWTFVAGAALVSTPIIIHLINRIRYRRVKWAAMEFLLKAQKRMRRRKILEQLLLLLMRCLLVFLAGILFARFLGCDKSQGRETRPTAHVVILDDTPSTADSWRREETGATNSFAEGKLVVSRLMKAANEATTLQTFQVIRLSDPDNPFPQNTKSTSDGKLEAKTAAEIRQDTRVSSDAIEAMEKYFAEFKDPSKVRRNLVEGLRKAKDLLDMQATGDTAKVIHFISDLRSVDWLAEGEAIGQLLKEYKDLGITVHFIDVGNPPRKVDRKSPLFSDNLAIIDLKPRNRVVAVNQHTTIEVRVKNFGSTDVNDVRIAFLLNGDADPIPSVPFGSIPANQERTKSIPVQFTRTGVGDDRLKSFNLITAMIMNADGGIMADNFRHAVVEVRPKLKVLVVEGRPEVRDTAKADSFHLRKLFLENKDFGGFDWEPTEAARLEGMDLRPYSTIYLLNVATLSEGAVANLERFVAEGGGVGVFLGPNVKPDVYTKLMYRDGNGFLPVPLQEKPKVLTQAQRQKRSDTFGKRILLRAPLNRQHPALSEIYSSELEASKVENSFLFTNIDAYWEILRLGNWRDDKSVQELYCMVNEKSILDYTPRVDALREAIQKHIGEPKFSDGQFKDLRKYLDPHLELLHKEAHDPNNHTALLARLLDQLLCDQINDGHESEPIFRAFWNEPELLEARQTAMRLRDDVKYGDPLYIAKQFGRGRVALITTDAGGTHDTDAGGIPDTKQWNDWPRGAGGVSWVPMVSEMQKYLSGGGLEGNLSVGDRFATEFEPGTREKPRYAKKVNRYLLSVDPKDGNVRKMELIPKPLGEQPLDQSAPPAGAAADAPPTPFQLSFADAKTPGVYVFQLTRLKGDKDPPATPTEQPDFVAVAFNIDSLREGDLRRANTDDLASWTNKAPLHTLEDLSWIDDFKQKPTDLSSRRWLYLVILLLLIAEQAWAVRISYHSKPEDLESFAPSAAAAFAHHTAPPPASAGEAAPAEPVEKAG
ncbi:MAG: BatA domain-containing protein [Planctomycetia bacterium]|nr:BatA domain-containing protein [Planctomycetia bacterium]